MRKIFDGLEIFGLKEYKEVVLFQPINQKAAKKIEKTQPAFDIKNYIYAKEFECPVCGKTFFANITRMGKTRLISTDYDLRPIYDPIEPMFYDMVLCTACGYAALKQRFLNISGPQAELIAEELAGKFKSVQYPDALTAEMAVERYKLVLLNTVLKKGREGEKAYICMKLCWLHRILGDREGELLFAEETLKGFIAAYANETPPIMGLEESTVLYILGAFSYTLGQNDDALRYLSKIIVSKSASERLKDRARDLKNTIHDKNKAARSEQEEL